MQLHETAERNRRIYEAHQAGQTAKSLAAEHGIHRQRIYQICHKAERLAEKRRRYETAAADWLDLTTRTRNAISSHYFPHSAGDTPFTAQAIAAVIGTKAQLAQIRNLGRKSMNEIATWLEKHGESLPEPPPPEPKPSARCPHCNGEIRITDIYPKKTPPFWLAVLAPDQPATRAAEHISATCSAEELIAMPGFDHQTITQIAKYLYRDGYLLRKKPGPVKSHDDIISV